MNNYTNIEGEMTILSRCSKANSIMQNTGKGTIF